MKTKTQNNDLGGLTPLTVLGYTNWWQKYIAPKINRLFQSGPGSPTTQKVTLTEILTLSCECSSK